MSRKAALADFLTELDTESQAALAKAVSELDSTIDKRFEAQDDVIQQVLDVAEDIEAKVDDVLTAQKRVVKPVSLDGIQSAISAVGARVLDAKGDIISALTQRSSGSDGVPTLAAEVKRLHGRLDALITMVAETREAAIMLRDCPRVPIYDGYGRVIGSRLDKTQ